MISYRNQTPENLTKSQNTIPKANEIEKVSLKEQQKQQQNHKKGMLIDICSN